MRQGFYKIIGQHLAKRVLTRAVCEGSPAHAYLFLGPEGTGKMTTALEFAKALNCASPVDGNACGECPMCRTIDADNAPDVRTWAPVKQETTIGQMREMRDYAILRPMRAKWKINIIEQGDTMNDESSNCILKLLEEPPPYLVNIMIYRNAANALPTIRSRCQHVRFTQVGAAELVDRLLEDFGAENDQARFLATYTEGCPGKAIRLIGDTGFAEKREATIELAASAASGNPWLSLRLAESLRSEGSKPLEDQDEDDESSEPGEPEIKPKSPKGGQRAAVIQSLDMLLLWYRDLLAAKLQGADAAYVNVDRAHEVTAQAMAYPHGGRILAAIESILEAKRVVLGNGNPQIVTEALMMKLTVG